MKIFFGLAGPGLFLLTALTAPVTGLSSEAWLVAGLAAWMILWWVFEVVPLAVTSLLPLVVLPVFGLASGKELSESYANATVMLVLGGFTLGLAIEKHRLHETLATYLLSKVSLNPYLLLAITMGLTAAFSMWISNTATTIMMLPIVIAATQRLPTPMAQACGPAFMLGVAYAASIGGMMTLIGTATNAQFKAYAETHTGSPIDFLTWMMFAVPVGLIMLIAAWAILAQGMPKPIMDLRPDPTTDGPRSLVLSSSQKRVCLIFGATIAAWIFNGSLISPMAGRSVPDSSIALLAAVAFFLCPADERSQKLLEWNDMKNLPWGVLLLLGGGLALASTLASSGVAGWVASFIPNSENPIIVMFACLILVLVVSEVMSNVAAVAALLPILTSLASTSDINFVAFTAPIILAASCAFMLPMSTPPNAIVFSAGTVTIRDMVRAGFRLNLVGFACILILAEPLSSWLFD